MSEFLKLSEAVSLALHTMAILERCTKLICTKKIAEILNASPNHLSKIMQRLTRVGLVESIRGPRGGFRLAKESEKISLLEIYESIEGPVKPSECSICEGSCLLARLLRKMENDFVSMMKETTLKEFGESFSQNLKIHFCLE